MSQLPPCAEQPAGGQGERSARTCALTKNSCTGLGMGLGTEGDRARDRAGAGDRIGDRTRAGDRGGQGQG